MKYLEQNGTFLEISNLEILVNLPKDKTIVNCGWMYETKYNIQGHIDRYKARLVAKGYSQIFGIDI